MLKIILLFFLSLFLLYLVIQGVRCFVYTQKTEQRLLSYFAKNATLSYGNMSYIDIGAGEVILSIHGIFGGYDQAFETLKDKTDSYRIIAPSRFGYLDSDILGDGTPKEQVESYVELLDQLEIDKVYLLATSAGGTVAIRFALDYPERTKDIPESTIRTIASRKPLRVVFRDSSFASAPEKINVTEIFKTITPDTSVKVM